MKIVIFAGGTGRRLWPISRKQTPKQFEPILGERSTVQLAVDRVLETYGASNIYVSTNQRYREIIREQLPALPPQNVIGEPERRDLAPAVGLAMAHLASAASDPDEPVAILWGDNYMSDAGTFRELLAAGAELIRTKRAKSSLSARRRASPTRIWDGLAWARSWERLPGDPTLPSTHSSTARRWNGRATCSPTNSTCGTPATS
jgi:mannose-1-phosphate guanylyltransferase